MNAVHLCSSSVWVSAKTGLEFSSLCWLCGRSCLALNLQSSCLSLLSQHSGVNWQEPFIMHGSIPCIFFNFESIIVIILICSKWYVTYLRKDSTFSKFIENSKLTSQFKFQGWEIVSVSVVLILSVQGKAIWAARLSNPSAVWLGWTWVNL